MYLPPFALADQLVTCGEWLDFIEDDGYLRPELWLSDGWATVQSEGWLAPLYWAHSESGWREFTLGGPIPLNPAQPVCHLSFYEADAFARWAGLRLPTGKPSGRSPRPVAPTKRSLLGPGRAPSSPTTGSLVDQSHFGNLWQWTSSAYGPYPGFLPATGAVGRVQQEGHGEQYVLRGGSCVTSCRPREVQLSRFFPGPGPLGIFPGSASHGHGLPGTTDLGLRPSKKNT